MTASVLPDDLQVPAEVSRRKRATARDSLAGGRKPVKECVELRALPSVV
jgi:hypothetical protein